MIADSSLLDIKMKASVLVPKGKKLKISNVVILRFRVLFGSLLGRGRVARDCCSGAAARDCDGGAPLASLCGSPDTRSRLFAGRVYALHASAGVNTGKGIEFDDAVTTILKDVQKDERPR